MQSCCDVGKHEKLWSDLHIGCLLFGRCNVLNKEYFWEAEANKATWWRVCGILAPFILNRYVWSGFKYWWPTSATSRSVCRTPLLAARKTARSYLWSLNLLRCNFCVNKLFSKCKMNDQWNWKGLCTLKTAFWNTHERYVLTSNLFENVSYC